MFISYSHADTERIVPITRLLQAAGALTFRDSDIQLGMIWRDSLAEAIADCSALVLFWTASAAHSQEVRREWQTAQALGKRIIPVLLDAVDLEEELKNYQYVDLCGIYSELLQLMATLETPELAAEEILRALGIIPAREALFTILGIVIGFSSVVAVSIGFLLIVRRFV
jgi:hypothetical protein